ncbi:MAG: YfhO family protein [Clostridia bacterium]|nr:YfhO family protein [Clostridia bacterium]
MPERNPVCCKKRWLFVPALFVLLLVLVIYAQNRIFPFGTESVVHDDMGQCNVPLIYTVWDALHGNGSILLNLRTAGGVFISGAYENALSPVNILLFLLCPRDKLLESMSFFLLIKMMLAATTAMLLFSRRFSISPFWCMVFSVLYAFNPFLLQYYSNASWLEVVWVAPLVLLGADILLRGKNPALYTLALAYCLIVQLYIAYMVVLFLFLEGAAYIVLLLPKKKRRSAAVRFGISTVLAVCVSAFSALPSFFYMTSSSRFQSTKNYFQVLLSSATNPASKFGMVTVLTALCFAAALVVFLHIRSDTKTVLFFGFSLLLFLLPVVFENINLLWHMGSYINFSMRYAFLLQLMLLITACFAIEKYPASFFCGKTNVHVFALIGALSAFTAGVICMRQFFDGTETLYVPKKIVPLMGVAFLLVFAGYFLLLKFGFKKLSCVLIAGFCAFECHFYVTHAVLTGSKRLFEYSLAYISECNDIHDTLSLDRSEYARIKNIDGTLNSNYPLIVDYPSMSNFTHTIPSTIKKTMVKLGYSSVYTRILDTGGTLFTDALLGYRYAISLAELPQEDFRYLSDAGSYGVYESRYAVPFGTVCSDAITKSELFGESAYETQNNLWHCVQDGEKDLMEIPQLRETSDKSGVTYDLDVTGTREVYIVCSGTTKRRSMRITVNGDPVSVPSLGEPYNAYYTTRFNNSLLSLGEYTDTHLSIRVQFLNNTITEKKLVTKIALMDKSLLQDFAQDKAEHAVSVQAERCTVRASAAAEEDGRFLFLPIPYDSGWSCTVNGKAVSPVQALSTFIAIPLQKGENSIRLHYLPTGFLPGLICSVCGLILSVFWFLRYKKFTRSWKKNKAFAAVLPVYCTADLCALAALYIIPILCKCIMVLLRLLR